MADGLDFQFQINPKDYRRIMGRLSKGNKTVGIALTKVRSKAAGIIRDRLAAVAPRRDPGSIRSAASRLYGPLKSRRKYTVMSKIKDWGVAAPYYMIFVVKGRAGKKKIMARPYVQRAVNDTRKQVHETIRAGILKVLREHFGDRFRF